MDPHRGWACVVWVCVWARGMRYFFSVVASGVSSTETPLTSSRAICVREDFRNRRACVRVSPSLCCLSLALSLSLASGFPKCKVQLRQLSVCQAIHDTACAHVCRFRDLHCKHFAGVITPACQLYTERWEKRQEMQQSGGKSNALRQRTMCKTGCAESDEEWGRDACAGCRSLLFSRGC